MGAVPAAGQPVGPEEEEQNITGNSDGAPVIALATHHMREGRASSRHASGMLLLQHDSTVTRR